MNLGARGTAILHKLLNTKDYITIVDLTSETQVSSRSVYYDLQKINDLLRSYNIEEIIYERTRGFYLTLKQKEQITALLEEKNYQLNLSFTPNERIMIMICCLIQNFKVLTIDEFISICKVSRNTVINDLKIVEEKLFTFDLKLSNEIKRGYFIEGEVLKKRALFFLYFPQIVKIYQESIYDENKFIEVSKTNEALNYIEKSLDTNYVNELVVTLANFIPILKDNKETLYFDSSIRKQMEESFEYQLVVKMFPTLSEDNKLYITLHLLGSRLQSEPYESFESEDEEAYQIAKDLVSEFSRISFIDFENKEIIERGLFIHLKSSLYRYRYGIQFGNPLKDDIYMQYRELFELTKRASKILERRIGVPINDNEIAYLTLHFGAHITSNTQEDELHIVIVCPNGISTSNMLKEEISALIPNANSIRVVTFKEVEKYVHDDDIVISTIPIIGTFTNILVHPILSDEDRIQILRNCVRVGAKEEINVEDLMRIIEPYIKEENREELVVSIEEYVYRKNRSQYHSIIKNTKGLKDFVNEDKIQFFDEDIDWQRAIHLAGFPLINLKSIEECYLDAIITMIRELGPYMFISDEVVLAHAKSEDGVQKTDVCISYFPKGVLFSKGREAKVIITLAAQDQMKHLKILSDIIEIMSDETKKCDFLMCKNKEEVLFYLLNR